MSDQTKIGTPDQKVIAVVLKPIKFLQQRGPDFRTIHAHGGWGTLHPDGSIQLDLFVEHAPIPEAVVCPVTPQGALTGESFEEFSRVDEKHFLMIREYQTAVVMSLTAAKQVHMTLGNFISGAEEQLKVQTQAANK